MMDSMLKGVSVITGVRIKAAMLPDFGDVTVVYTGKIDEFFGYQFGILPYRSLDFKHEVLPIKDFQGNAIINYTDKAVPYTRIVEHKHFVDVDPCGSCTIITKEYPKIWHLADEAYYPIRDVHNESSLYEKYKAHAAKIPNLYFQGRLGEYQYYNMDQVVRKALDFSKILLR